MIVALGILVAISVPASADRVESTTGVCYQNDGADDFGTGCDFPDTPAALLATPNDANMCNTKLTVDAGKTWGTLYPTQPGVPDMDPADVCRAALLPNLEPGSRISFTLSLANQDTASFSVSLHIYDGATGEPLPARVESAAADGIGVTPGANDGLPFAVHSGVSPFHPISVSEVFVDGASSTSQSKAVLDIGQLDFVVKNTPALITVDGTSEDLTTGDAIRLCAYSGDISYALTALGGNIKLDGQAVGFAMATSLSALPACAQIVLDPVCQEDADGYVYVCTLNVSAEYPMILLEARAHELRTGEVSLVAVGQMKCHTLCTTLGIEDPFPSDWAIDLDQLAGGSPS